MKDFTGASVAEKLALFIDGLSAKFYCFRRRLSPLDAFTTGLDWLRCFSEFLCFFPLSLSLSFFNWHSARFCHLHSELDVIAFCGVVWCFLLLCVCAEFNYCELLHQKTTASVAPWNCWCRSCANSLIGRIVIRCKTQNSHAGSHLMLLTIYATNHGIINKATCSSNSLTPSLYLSSSANISVFGRRALSHRHQRWSESVVFCHKGP